MLSIGGAGEVKLVYGLLTSFLGQALCGSEQDA